MLPRILVAACLLLCACAPDEAGRGKAFIGALLIDGSGDPPLSDSVVVTAGDRLRDAGPRGAIPVPAEADKIDGSGKVLVPVPIDVCDRAGPATLLRAADPADAARQVAGFAASKAAVVYLPETSSAIAESALEAARAARIPVLARCSTQAQARFLVERGASGLIGMIRDTADLDPGLVARLRDLRIVVAPALVQAGAALEIASRNTHRLFQAGVPMAAASLGGGLQRELALLVEAGIPPLDVLVAATRNGALALNRPDRGTIQPGKRADLLLLSANPGENIANLEKVALRMEAGEWRK
jgi:imidazolonepropionase-like amidohydrolase